MKPVLRLLVALAALALPLSDALAKYTGEALKSDNGWTAVVRDEHDRIVWIAKQESSSEEAAEEKADKKAKKMNKDKKDGLYDDCEVPHEGCPGYGLP